MSADINPRRNMGAFRKAIEHWPIEQWEVISPRSQQLGMHNRITKLCLRQLTGGGGRPRRGWWVIRPERPYYQSKDYAYQEFRAQLWGPNPDRWLIRGDLRALLGVRAENPSGTSDALVEAMHIIGRRLGEDPMTLP